MKNKGRTVGRKHAAIGSLLLGLLFSVSCRYETSPTRAIGEYASGVAAVATQGGKVDGVVYYEAYKADSVKHGTRPRPIQRCVLQHGYGITQSVIDAGKAAAQKLNLGKFSYDSLDFFASIYFGKTLINRLLTSACDEVIVPVQESNNTTILEMTRRTERFLRDEICTGKDRRNGQIPCALVGHSKGGAVAFSIARRCMQKTSELGEMGCARIGKFYSATGVVQGAGIPALLYGAKKLRNVQVLEDLEAAASLYSQVLSHLGSFVWDLQSDHVTGRTNPTWLDLSPLAPMEDRVPLFIANAVALKRQNWLTADFAASATQYDFARAPEEGLAGCGNRGKKPTDPVEALRWHEQFSLCTSFGKSLAAVHNELHDATHDYGVNALLEDVSPRLSLVDAPRFAQELRGRLTWSNFQIGDGFASYDLALQSCLNALHQPETAVTRCTTFKDLNHQATAGGAVEAADDILAHLLEKN